MLPFALIGGIWLVYLLGHNISVATAVGFIALAGLAAEFGVVSWSIWTAPSRRGSSRDGYPGPIILTRRWSRGRAPGLAWAMTVAVILGGLFPLLIGHGTGAEVMQRLAAPMVGGMITAPFLSLFVLPAVYKHLGCRRFAAEQRNEDTPDIGPLAHPELN